MALEYWNGTAKVPFTKLEYWNGSTKVEIKSLSYWDGEKKVQFYSAVPPLAVSKSPPGDFSVVGTTSTLTSPVQTAAVSGGVPPYNYFWSVTTQDSGNVTASTPTAQSTTFRITGLSKWETSYNILQLTVTDSTGAQASINFNSDWTRNDPNGLPPP